MMTIYIFVITEQIKNCKFRKNGFSKTESRNGKVAYLRKKNLKNKKTKKDSFFMVT